MRSTRPVSWHSSGRRSLDLLIELVEEVLPSDLAKVDGLGFGLVVEPGGAVALAAALFGRLPVADRTVAVVLTGANVDPGMYQRALSTII